MHDEIDAFSRGLIESAPDAFVVLDGRGCICLVNAQAEALLGYGREQLLGCAIERLVKPGELGVGALLTERRVKRLGDAPSRFVELELLRGNGGPVPVEISISVMARGTERFTILIVRDLVERRALEQLLRFRSTHDALTGLENRGAFDEALQRFAARGPLPIGVLMLDLDGLKTVNDRFGHAAGDELLQRTAALLRESFRSEDVVARIGGDEFAVLAPGQDERALALMTRRLEDHLRRHNAERPQVPLHLSVGFSVAEAPSALPNAVREADARMYVTKRLHHA